MMRGKSLKVWFQIFLKNRYPLEIKNKNLYWDLYLKANSEAEDF